MPVTEALAPTNRPTAHCHLSPGHNQATQPSVVFFDDELPDGALVSALTDLVDTDLLVAVYSSLAVSPVDTLPFCTVMTGIPILYLDPEKPAITFPMLHLKGKAEEILPTLIGD